MKHKAGGNHMNRNGFFQVLIKMDGTYLKIYPAVEEGKEITLDEITSYLTKHQIAEYNLPAINKGLQQQEETVVKLTNEKTFPISEDMDIIVSSDKMKAIARFYPASNDGSQMDEAEIYRGFTSNGIKYGIKKESVSSYLKDRKYCTDYIIAVGTKPIEGKDAKIEYSFNTNLSARPKLNEDGSVDFHQLQNMNSVTEGTILATLTKEVTGTPGVDVFGKAILPTPIKVKKLLYGSNIALSEDGLQLIAKVDGHVVLKEDGKVVLSNVYEVDGDVDTSTGDISYKGDVEIRGNVRTGFTVIAKGNINVQGVVEGARLIAGGNIVIQRGIQGMSRGIVQAQGNVIAKFIESATVQANGYIEVDAIMHSKVTAKTEIHVSGKKGLIVGGYVRAGNLIQAQTIGSSMGGSTCVEVGNDPAIQDRLAQLKEEKKKLEAEEYQLGQVLEVVKKKQQKGILEPSKLVSFQKSLMQYKEVTQKLQAIEKEAATYEGNIGESDGGRIKVDKIIYPGVKVSISGEFTIISDTHRCCQFIKEWHEIKRIN